MKTTLTYTSLDAQAPWPALLTQQLDHWHTLATITAAEVVLEHQHRDEKGYHVKVRLEMAGPSLRAEACATTLDGALLLVTQEVARQIQSRKDKPVGRERSRPATKGHFPTEDKSQGVRHE
jgi:ribosome-associated translation inhibitor RaiA